MKRALATTFVVMSVCTLKWILHIRAIRCFDVGGKQICAYFTLGVAHFGVHELEGPLNAVTVSCEVGCICCLAI